MKKLFFLSLFLFLLFPRVIFASGINTLEQQFYQSTVKEKYIVIEDMLASGPVDLSFLNQLLNTDEFEKSFPTVDLFRVLQSRTAIEMGMVATPEISKILYDYYYGNSRSRILIRPESYELRHDWQKILAEIDDHNGTKWALTKIWWFRCSNDLWLVKKGKGEEHWSGPWFTGINSLEAPAMRIKSNDIHIINPASKQEHVISLKMITHDSDDDGLYDTEELRFGTDSSKQDTDGDGIIDGSDMNPLSPGKKHLRPFDYARIATFRHEKIIDYPFNIYLVEEGEEDRLEYFSSSTNATILSVTPELIKEFQRQCAGAKRQDIMARRPTRFFLQKQSEDMIQIDVDTAGETNRYLIEKRHGVWVVTDRRTIRVYRY